MKKNDRILLAHGGGGVLTHELIAKTILPAMGSSTEALPDAAAIPGTGSLMMTTDSFVVKPLFFRGGDIGSLSIHGTINDLAVSGAEPLAISMGLIIEEGLEISILRKIIASAAKAAEECGVRIITGDTKVVARGEADQLFINTAGIGARKTVSEPSSLAPGDCVIINGAIADHGVAVMSEREGISFQTEVRSDSASVWPFVKAIIEAGIKPKVMRDPTRGGIASCCVELAEDSGVTIELDEKTVPVRRETRAACDMLGLDPLTVANEGKVVVFVEKAQADKTLEIMRGVPGGENAVIMGKVTERARMPVLLRTKFGGQRIVEMPYGEELPRIC